MTNLVLLFALGLFIAISHASHIPSDWKACQSSDPDRNKCLTLAVAQALSDLMDGNQDLGIKSMDPINIPFQNLTRGNFRMITTDLKMFGLKRAIIKEIETDWKTLKIVVIVPEIHAVGRYQLDGKFKSIPIAGEGLVEIVAGNLRADFRLKLSEKDKGGVVYYHIDESSLGLDTESFGLKFDNLGDEVNEEMNKNWKETWAVVKVPLSRCWNTLLTEIAEAIFDQIPKNELSPI